MRLMLITSNLNISTCSYSANAEDITNIALIGIDNHCFFFPLSFDDQDSWGLPKLNINLHLDKQDDSIKLDFYDRNMRTVIQKTINIPSEKIQSIVSDCLSKHQNIEFESIVLGITKELYIAEWLYCPKLSKLLSWQGNDLGIMKNYLYRYLIQFSAWDETNNQWSQQQEGFEDSCFDSIEEKLFNGTLNKMNDGTLLNYHKGGIPLKLKIKWHTIKLKFELDVFFNHGETVELFKKYYGIHPDTKTDILIRIDSKKNRYDISFYRYGMKKPVAISSNAYQLIVFKSGFEHHRSTNYNQKKGAWIW